MLIDFIDCYIMLWNQKKKKILKNNEHDDETKKKRNSFVLTLNQSVDLTL